MCWPGKILSGSLITSRLASKIRRQSLALPYSRLAIFDNESPEAMVRDFPAWLDPANGVVKAMFKF